MSDLANFRSAWSEETVTKTREAIEVARDRNDRRLERIVDRYCGMYVDRDDAS
ncbi:hypothetical protein [Haloplanus salinarum]|uniref:hypothetical protein n=1 Tax=Haloplanus salinarum TaxID=1912324 RepID=UPI00214B1698|nr:hypothetical protein [Haloplanus salinarum]